MIKLKHLYLVPIITLLIPLIAHAQPELGTDWYLAELLAAQSNEIKFEGNPKQVSSPLGTSVYFDGVSDAFFLDQMPLKSLEQFTVEMIFKPVKDAPIEQRILHIGEVSEDRMLLEIRASETSWYFDGFVASDTNNKALIEPKFIHPLDKWYHVALVVGPESMSTYVDGMLELYEPFSFTPFQSGQTSIGVRQNNRSWFKGEIHRIRITPKKLRPEEFMTLKP